MHRLTQNIKKYQVAVFAFTLLLSGAWSVDFASAQVTISGTDQADCLQKLQNAGATSLTTCVTPSGASFSGSNSSTAAQSTGNSTSSPSSSNGSSSGCSSGSGIVIPCDTGLPSGTVSDILTNFFKWLLIIFSIFAVGAFIISGIQYLISAGDDKSIATAKMNMKWSIIGVAVGLSGYIILTAVQTALNASSTTF